MVTVQQRGLGKGLSALIGENNLRSSAAKPDGEVLTREEKGTQLRELGLDALQAGKYQPRSRFTEEELRELSVSIAKNGIMQPIVARYEESSGKYEIIAGERRWRAARMARLETVPVLVRELTDQQALELALVENIQRKDLTPLEEATGYQRLMDEFSYTQEQLAQTVGKSRSHVANLLRLLSLPQEVATMLDEGLLSMGHARALLTAGDPVGLAQRIVDGDLSVRAAEDLARNAAGTEKQFRPRSGTPPVKREQRAGGDVHKDADILALEDNLSENLGLKVSINDRGQHGEIVLQYTSLSQLDEILKKLGGGML